MIIKKGKQKKTKGVKNDYEGNIIIKIVCHQNLRCLL